MESQVYFPFDSFSREVCIRASQGYVTYKHPPEEKQTNSDQNYDKNRGKKSVIGKVEFPFAFKFPFPFQGLFLGSAQIDSLYPTIFSDRCIIVNSIPDPLLMHTSSKSSGFSGCRLRKFPRHLIIILVRFLYISICYTYYLSYLRSYDDGFFLNNYCMFCLSHRSPFPFLENRVALDRI